MIFPLTGLESVSASSGHQRIFSDDNLMFVCVFVAYKVGEFRQRIAALVGK